MSQIDEYRNQVLDVLKQSNNHYPTNIINLQVGDNKLITIDGCILGKVIGK
jgi:hypothetical protein